MDKDIEHLKYLDEILFCLRGHYHSKARFEDLFKDISAKEIPFNTYLDEEPSLYSDEKTAPINTLDLEGFKRSVFKEAIHYLENLGLVYLTAEDNNSVHVTLTYRGRIKITDTFVDEYRKEQDEKELRAQHMKDTRTVALIQKWTLPSAVIVAILAIFAAYWKPTSTYHTYYKCYHKQNVECKVPEMDNSRSLHVKHEPNDSTSTAK